MEKEIKNFIEDYGSIYIKINDEQSIKKIYDLLINNIIVEPINDIEYLYFGFYYQEVIKDFEIMLKYYLKAIQKGNSDAMFNLGSYYKEQGDYKQMEKYYLEAINNGDNDAMNNLEVHYLENNNYIELIKFYYKYNHKKDLIKSISKF